MVAPQRRFNQDAPIDIEEFPLLLQSDEVRELIEAARPQGLCAAGLARLVIRDYLRRRRGEFVGISGYTQRPSGAGEGR